MVVGDIMTLGAQTIRAEDSIARAAQKMDAHNVSVLPVLENHQLIGAISDRDIVVRGISQQLDPQQCTVRDIMTPHVAVCFESQHVEEAAHLMRQQRIRHLFVLNQEQKLVGILSLGDLVEKGGNVEAAEKVLQGLSKRPMPAQRGITE